MVHRKTRALQTDSRIIQHVSAKKRRERNDPKNGAAALSPRDRVKRKEIANNAASVAVQRYVPCAEINDAGTGGRGAFFRLFSCDFM
ncbi:hypothetical protein M427DRAFT_137126 [Gonapodya prolifera JEL478]|uniref:Uncharacterized protein n=1 Tax=Gonapodya prolifera (strain JEL478) TaxID=1344416 RepID=A0A139A724_GONPJ|nr:hypothetical protein M427DRAFT_137126 [Gonapodya prolifera JEL478]|eukprot:KXS12600.1 hypothetical protein M427DRAFT_137126 [Gonapodya prolifera JEL478]